METKTNSLMQNADEIYFKPVEGESALQLELENDVRLRFVGLVEDRFATAERARDHDENRWLTAYHNFRGLYPKHIKFKESEKSKVFIKVTKTKVLAAFGQLVDVIFGTGQFPIGVRETEIPEGISTYKHLDLSPSDIEGSQAPTQEKEKEMVNPFEIGFEGDG